MINVVFDPATAGTLFHAVVPGVQGRIEGKDIIILDWCMDIGYLREGIESEYRSQMRDQSCLKQERL